MSLTRKATLQLIFRAPPRTSQRTLAHNAFKPLHQCFHVQTPLSSSIARPAPRAIQHQSLRWRSNPAASASPASPPSASTDGRNYDFADVQELVSSPSKDRILIDVREPSEYEAGFIPTAINIPIKTQPDAIFLPEEEFHDRFGFTKPDPEHEVVFYCRSGVRSHAAAQLAKQSGYSRVSEYQGSWLDWQKNGGKEEKP